MNPSIAGRNVSAGDHREQHADAGGDREPVEEADPQGEHPEERDAHDRPGEQHGATGRVDRELYRGRDVAPRPEALTVTRDDEQGVVDADPEADQQHELGGEFRHLHHVADQPDHRDRRAERDQSRRERHRHREQRAEHQEQDDPGGDDPGAYPSDRWLVRPLGE